MRVMQLKKENAPAGYERANVATLALHSVMFLGFAIRYMMSDKRWVHGFFFEFVVLAHVLYTVIIPSAMFVVAAAGTVSNGTLETQLALSIVYASMALRELSRKRLSKTKDQKFDLVIRQ